MDINKDSFIHSFIVFFIFHSRAKTQKRDFFFNYSFCIPNEKCKMKNEKLNRGLNHFPLPLQAYLAVTSIILA